MKITFKEVKEYVREFDVSGGDIVRNNIADNVRIARNKMGLSQAQLARVLGYKSATAISLIESGQRNIRPELIFIMARLADVNVQDFFFKGIIDTKLNVIQK